MRSLTFSRVLPISLLAMLLQASPCLGGDAPDAKAAARQEFELGVVAFGERRFDEAARHFEAAYRLSPAYAVLYNLGQVNAMLGRAVEAVKAYERYLDHGGVSIGADRRAEVEAEIERQRARIGTLYLRIEPEGATVRLDGEIIGQAPLRKPVPLTAGTHTVVAALDGHVATVRDVEVVGRSRLVLELALERVGGAQTGATAQSGAAASSAVPLEPPRRLEPGVPAPVGTHVGHTQRWMGLLAGSAGLAAAAGGGVLALVADANGRRSRKPRCRQDGRRVRPALRWRTS